MPATPLYAHRLADGIEALSANPADLVDRRMVEETLGVGKWTAWRIMKRCGAEDGPGGALVCRREVLIGELRKLMEDGRFGPEIARRRRVEEYLDGMVRYASRKHKQIARDEAAVKMLSSRLETLPEGVDLQRGELRIAFTGSDDFLRKIGALIFALNNDFEAIAEFLEG